MANGDEGFLLNLTQCKKKKNTYFWCFLIKQYVFTCSRIFLPWCLDRRKNSRWLTMLHNVSFHTQWANMASARFTWQASVSTSCESAYFTVCCDALGVLKIESQNCMCCKSGLINCLTVHQVGNLLSVPSEGLKTLQAKAGIRWQWISTDFQMQKQNLDSSEITSPASKGRYLFNSKESLCSKLHMRTKRHFRYILCTFHYRIFTLVTQTRQRTLMRIHTVLLLSQQQEGNTVIQNSRVARCLTQPDLKQQIRML